MKKQSSKIQKKYQNKRWKIMIQAKVHITHKILILMRILIGMKKKKLPNAIGIKKRKTLWKMVNFQLILVALIKVFRIKLRKSCFKIKTTTALKIKKNLTEKLCSTNPLIQSSPKKYNNLQKKYFFGHTTILTMEIMPQYSILLKYLERLSG